MAIGNMDLYKALKEAGASEETAAEAAKSVAGQLPRFWAVTGTLATLAALNLGLLGLQFRIVDRLGSLDARASAIEQRVSGLDERVSGIEERLAMLEDGSVQRHAEIMQQLELLARERGGGQP